MHERQFSPLRREIMPKKAADRNTANLAIMRENRRGITIIPNVRSERYAELHYTSICCCFVVRRAVQQEEEEEEEEEGDFA